MSIWNAVSGHGRTAASARLLAPRPHLPGAGVCPPPARLQYVADPVTARIGENGRPSGSFMQQSTHVSTRQFDKHDPGLADLRPPV
jgi:hypothetical protein